MVTEIREYFQKVSIAIADCELCCNTYEDAEHYNGSDLLHVATIEKYIAMIEDSIIQNEKHTGIALSGLLPEISVLLEEFKPLSAQIDFAGIMGDRDAFTYLAQVNRNFETFIALLKERCTAHGIQLPELQRELEYDSEPQQIILPKELNTDEARRIYENLIEGDYLAQDTDYRCFLHVFGDGCKPDDFKPLQWIKRNKRTGEPSKKSLLDFLSLIEVSDSEIKDFRLLNALFATGGNPYARKDYPKNGFKSEYRADLKRILKDGKD